MNTSIATTAATLLLFAISAQSQPLQIYDSEAAFFANANIESTESFDEFVSGTRFKEWSLIIDDVFYEIADGETHDCSVIDGDNCWTLWGGSGDGPPPVSLPNMLFSDALDHLGGRGADIISFGKHLGVEAIGFYFLSSAGYDWISTNQSPHFGWEIVVHECDGTVTNLHVPNEAAISATYFGFISAARICKIEVAGRRPPANTSSSQANWSYDSVSRSAIESIVLDMPINVRPWKLDPRSRKPMHVDLLSSVISDPVEVDINTVRFGPHRARVLYYIVKDIDGDGFADLRLRFRTSRTGIDCNTKTAILTGTTYDGQSVVGAGEVTTKCRN